MSNKYLDVGMVPRGNRPAGFHQRRLSSQSTLRDLTEIEGRKDKVVENMPDEQARKRCLALFEILSTEISYIKDLEFLVKNFLIPLREEKIFDGKMEREILPREEIPKIFSNIELLLSINSELADRLDKRLMNSNEGVIEKSLVEIFSAFVDNLKSYSAYCDNHPVARETVHACLEKYPTFSKFLDKVAMRTRSTLRLEDYLIKPVQRICKYPLLFTEVMKHTPETHPEYSNLREVLERLKQVTDFIDQSARRAENHRKLVDIDSNVEGFSRFVDDDRWFLKEADVQVANQGAVSVTTEKDRQQKPKNRRCFLFNDLLVICKLSNLKTGAAALGGAQIGKLLGKKYQLEHAIPLTMSLLQPLDSREQNYHTNGFIIVRVDSEKRKHYLYFNSKPVRDEWWKAIEEIVNRFLLSDDKKAADSPAGQRNPRGASRVESSASLSPAFLPSHKRVGSDRPVGASPSSPDAVGEELLQAVSELRERMGRLERELAEEKKARKMAEEEARSAQIQIASLAQEIESMKMDFASLVRRLNAGEDSD